MAKREWDTENHRSAMIKWHRRGRSEAPNNAEKAETRREKPQPSPKLYMDRRKEEKEEYVGRRGQDMEK